VIFKKLKVLGSYKLVALLSFGLLFMMSCNSETEIVIQKFPMGSVKEVHRVDSDGEVIQKKLWHFNELKSEVYSVKSDVKHGAYQSWTMEGFPKESGHYQEGLREGEWKLWYRLRKPLAVGQYRNGKKEGEWVYSYPEGGVRVKEIFTKGDSTGVWKTYFSPEKGGLLKVLTSCFKTTKLGFQKKYSESGQLLESVMCQFGKKHGRFESFDNEGRALVSGFYKQGQKDSVWERFSVDGKVVERKEWSDKKRVGLWFNANFKGDTLMIEHLPSLQKLVLDPKLRTMKFHLQTACPSVAPWSDFDEKICSDTILVNGLIEGEILTWKKPWVLDVETWKAGNLLYKKVYKSKSKKWASPNDVLVTQGAYKNGFVTGVWEVRDLETGIVREEKRYKDGKLLGEQRLYDATGKLFMKKHYKGVDEAFVIERVQ
jgi:antitoxin component YwqK of YwqJK toxin-antitoxin module